MANKVNDDNKLILKDYFDQKLNNTFMSFEKG